MPQKVKPLAYYWSFSDYSPGHLTLLILLKTLLEGPQGVLVLNMLLVIERAEDLLAASRLLHSVADRDSESVPCDGRESARIWGAGISHR